MFGNASLVLAVLVVVTTSQCFAQDTDRKRFTAVSIDEVDRDFKYSGEYAGTVKSEGGAAKRLGIQVVALGDGEFGGMAYAGGLPGSGWNGVDRRPLKGKRNGDLLVISDGPSWFEIVNDSAMAYREDGVIAGELAKVSRKSATLGMPAPQNAYTLFDGDNVNAFKDATLTDEGLMEEGTELLARFRDFTMHVEYRLPYMPYARGQDRSNSGLYLQSSYEVQVLDSFGLQGIENECGALYRYRRPNINMCLPPLTWQTYDLTFRSPRFDAYGNKIKNARITLLHNGVAVHDDFEIERKTGAGRPEEDVLRPIKFQDHSNPIRYRNIWLIDLAPSG